MRTFLLSLITILSIPSANAQYRLMGTCTSDGKPNYLVNPGDYISQSFRDDIAATLPEYRSVPLYNPRLIAPGRTETINTNCNTDLWVTFVDEGASYRNVLGYYTYPTNAPLASAPPASQITIIFPNASRSGSGGSLNPGDKVYLGNFPPNTSVGFVLLADGWNDDINTIGSSAKWILYSDSRFNPEKDSTLKKHTVILHDTSTNKIIIGFEDIRRDGYGSDQDFNDVLFYVTATPLQCVSKLDSIPDLTPDGHISFSGYSGGLESKSMGDALAKRIYNRAVNNSIGDIDYAVAPQLNTSGNITSFGSGTMNASNLRLSDVVPKELPDPGYTSYLSTPNDIPSMTNAVDVYSVDFTKNNMNRATVFATKTATDVYSHTKAVCDRLKNAKLLAIDSISINHLNYLTYTLQQASGNIEYVMSFSIGKSANRNAYSFQSDWLLSDYATEDTLYNFQIWGAAPYYCIDLAQNIISKFSTIQPVQQFKQNAALPNTYIIAGKRNGLNVDLTIKNNSNLTSGYFVFADKRNENSTSVNQRTVSFTMKPNNTSTISVPVNDVLESSIYMYTNNQQQDILFMSDGSWGIDYNNASQYNRNFIVTNDSSTNYDADNEFPLFRNIKATATFSDYIGIYKLLQGGAVAKDLTGFKNLTFNASSNNALVTIYLVKNSITDFSKQYAYTVPLTQANKNYFISLNDFKSTASNDVINPNDIVEIIFAIQTPDGKMANVSANISHIMFTKKDANAYTTDKSNDIQVYPNPSYGNVTISFNSAADETIIYKLIEGGSGKIMETKPITAKKGINNIPVYITQNGLHSYYIVIEGNSGTKYAAKQVIINR